MLNLYISGCDDAFRPPAETKSSTTNQYLGPYTKEKFHQARRWNGFGA
jgi:hypothetical protein